MSSNRSYFRLPMSPQWHLNRSPPTNMPKKYEAEVSLNLKRTSAGEVIKSMQTRQAALGKTIIVKRKRKSHFETWEIYYPEHPDFNCVVYYNCIKRKTIRQSKNPTRYEITHAQNASLYTPDIVVSAPPL